MSTRHKASCVKKRKSIVLEKLNDSSDSSSRERGSQIKAKKGKKIRSKNENPSSINNKNENNSEIHSKHFPIKNIYDPQLFINNLEELERYKCGLCENICCEPRYQYCPCDQVYCKECLNIYYDCYHNQCPKCQRVTKELIPKETFFEKLMKLKMICRNHIYQCPWNGIYEDYKDHIENECLKETINCPNKGCAIKLRREEMTQHVQKCEYREYICNKCLDKMAYIDKKLHKNLCPRGEILCPQNCGESIEREDYSEHKKVCKNSDIHCPFKIFGCKDKFQRNKKEERLIKDAPKHLDLTFKIILDLQKKINQMEKTIEDLKNKNGKNEINIYNENINENEESIKNNMNNKINDNNNSNQFLEKKRLTNDELKEDMMAPNTANFSIFDFPGNEIESYETKNIIDKNALFSEDMLNENYIYYVPKKYENFFNIEDNKIETHCLDGKKHYFIFFNKKYDIPKDSTKKYSFTFKLLTNCDSIEMGICDKEIIEMNNLEYDFKENNKNRRGVYSISSNQMLWNSNNNKDCIKLKYNKPLSKIDTTILITFDPKNRRLEFMLNNEQFVDLKDVKCFYSKCFSPFLIFLKNGKIQTFFNY